MSKFQTQRGYGTHLPVLLEAFFRTQGQVVENGAGLFSTEVLSMLCRMADRPLTTIERNREWLDVASHPGRIVDTVNSLDATERFGLALIDGALNDRLPVILSLRSRTDVFVIHDWNSKAAYRYPTDWKYLRVYEMLMPTTAICSDTQDVRQPFRSK